VSRLVAALNRERKAVNGSRILLLGLAYKRNSGDARESPAMVVAHRLLALGAEVRAADPHVVEEHVVDSRVVRVDASPEELAAADAVILLTDHDLFDLDSLATHSQLVLDTRRRVGGDGIERL
jgi:UDP-N-acetyl-D-glucosamine dehydrogenase